VGRDGSDGKPGLASFFCRTTSGRIGFARFSFSNPARCERSGQGWGAIRRIRVSWCIRCPLSSVRPALSGPAASTKGVCRCIRIGRIGRIAPGRMCHPELRSEW